MALIQTIEPEKAEGKVKEIYDFMQEINPGSSLRLTLDPFRKVKRSLDPNADNRS